MSICSSVCSTADTTVKESGLLPLATISTNLRAVELLTAVTTLAVLSSSSTLLKIGCSDYTFWGVRTTV